MWALSSPDLICGKLLYLKPLIQIKVSKMKKQNNHRALVLLLSVCAAASTLTPKVALADRKTMVAAGCKFKDSTIPWRSDSGSMYNLSRERQLLVCPLVRDNTSEYLTDVDVFLEDRSPTEGIICWVVVENENQTGRVADGIHTSNSFTGWTRKDMDPTSLNTSIATTHAYYRLECELPGVTDKGYASGIIAYSWKE